VNPKVNNMVQGYEFARHDLILISDCGLRSTFISYYLGWPLIWKTWKIHGIL